MIVSALVIVSYTIMGGFSAVCITDLVQSIVMSAALVIVVFFGVHVAGGWDAVAQNAQSLAGYLSLNETFDAVTNTAQPYGIVKIISTMAWGLGYFGIPHILVRFMAIEDEKKLVISRRIATIWVVIAMSVGILVGVVGLAMSRAGAIEQLEDSETIIMAITGLLSKYGIIAALVAGIILAGILASTMSTSDSQLLTAASGASKDILQDFFHIKMSEKTGLMVARGTIIGIAIISMFLARDPEASVFKIVSFAWAGFGGAFGAVILCSLFWKRTNLFGALSGMIAGGTAVFLWKFLVRPMGGVFDIYELLPAFLVSLIVTILFSLITKAPSQEILGEFKAASQEK